MQKYAILFDNPNILCILAHGKRKLLSLMVSEFLKKSENIYKMAGDICNRVDS